MNPSETKEGLDLDSAEIQAILRGLRVHLSGDLRHGMPRIDSEGLDWERIIAATLHHGVMPVFYRALRNSRGSAPPIALEKLKARYLANAGRGYYLARELGGITNLLQRRGIDALAYKGPALAVRAYGDPIARQAGDLDLLIRREDAGRAFEALRGAGFRPQRPMPASLGPDYLSFECEYNLRRSEGILDLELHWRFLPWYFSADFEYERLWLRAATLEIEESPVRTLSPEDEFIALAMHNGCKHRWERLANLVDLARAACCAPAMDWDFIARDLRALGLQRIAGVGVVLARELLLCEFPSEKVARLGESREVLRLAEFVKRRLLASFRPEVTAREFRIFDLESRERLRDKIRYYTRLRRHRRHIRYQEGRCEVLAQPEAMTRT